MEEITKLFFYLIVIFMISFSISHFTSNKSNIQNKTINVTMDYNKMMNILRRDNELLEMILNGAKVSGPNRVIDNERKRFPAIYKELPNKIYKAEIRYNNRKIMILFDQNKIYKKVNLMNLKI